MLAANFCNVQVVIDQSKQTIEILDPLTGTQEEVAGKINAICQKVVQWLENKTFSTTTFVSFRDLEASSAPTVFSFPPTSGEKVPSNMDQYSCFSVIYTSGK